MTKFKLKKVYKGIKIRRCNRDFRGPRRDLSSA